MNRAVIIILLAASFLTSLVFVILRAAGVIDWGWFFITLPILIGWGIPAVLFIVLGTVYYFCFFS